MAVARPTTHADEPVEKVESLDDLRRIAADVQYDHRPRLVSIAGGGNITLAPARKNRRRPTPAEKAEADEEAFRSTFGALAGEINLDGFMHRVKEGRC